MATYSSPQMKDPDTPEIRVYFRTRAVRVTSFEKVASDYDPATKRKYTQTIA